MKIFLYSSMMAFPVCRKVESYDPCIIKGEGIYAFVILNAEVRALEGLKKTLINHVRKEMPHCHTGQDSVC